MKQIFATICFLSLFSFAHAEWMDQSTKLFFPQQEGKMFNLYQKMPATWWNFFFYDKNKISKDEVCEKILSLNPSYFLFNPCSPSFMEKDWLQSWAFDNLFAKKPPTSTKELESLLNKTLVRMSLPQSPEWLELQRIAPTADFSQIQKNFAEFYKMSDDSDQWGLLPVLFNYSPDDFSITEEIETQLKDPSILSVGPHFGSIANKRLIKKDLNIVMTVGLALFFIFFLYLFFSRKKLFFLLIPGLGISLFFASLLVIITWGSIHGLTLAFGSGLVGISMDYAFHGWPERHKSQVWKSNSISFLTTFCAFALLSFFSIPLIKQLSFFSLSGLTFSFIFTYLVSLKTPQELRPQSLKIPTLKGSRLLSYLFLGVLVIFLAVGFLKNHFDFSLARMDSTQIKNQQVLDSSTQQMDKNQYAFLMTPFSSYETLDEQYLWAKEKEIPYLGLSSLRGTEKEYQKNYSQWVNLACSSEFIQWEANLQPQLRKIFSDFLAQLNCESLKNYKNSNKSYLNLFVSNNNALSIFRVSDDTNKELILNQYPNTFFVSEITHSFPQKLKKEISYFIGFVFVAVFLILLFFLRSQSFYSFIPPLGAASFAFTTHLILDSPLTFMSFVSLIILLGLTLDFGIFCTTRIFAEKKLNKTFGSITLSAVTSLVGFAPLAFCQHPVLRDLGMTIFSGVVGAFVASLIIYPGLKLTKREQNV